MLIAINRPGTNNICAGSHQFIANDQYAVNKILGIQDLVTKSVDGRCFSAEVYIFEFFEKGIPLTGVRVFPVVSPYCLSSKDQKIIVRQGVNIYL